MEKDISAYEAMLKETCRDLYHLANKAEIELACGVVSSTTRSYEMVYKTRMALQIITGCDEEDATELVEKISEQENLKLIFEDCLGGSNDKKD